MHSARGAQIPAAIREERDVVANQQCAGRQVSEVDRFTILS